jgi:hypothetical protein
VVFKDVIKTANTATTFFLNKPRARAALRQHQLDEYTKVKQLSLPPDTRFAYEVDMLDRLADYAKALQLCSKCVPLFLFLYFRMRVTFKGELYFRWTPLELPHFVFLEALGYFV